MYDLINDINNSSYYSLILRKVRDLNDDDFKF